MKKLLTIFFIFLLFNIPAQADDIASGFEDKSDFKNNVTDFNKWLHEKGHHQYLIIKTRSLNQEKLHHKKWLFVLIAGFPSDKIFISSTFSLL